MLGPQPQFHNWQRVLVQWIQVTKSAKQRKINRSYPSEIISCNLDGTYDVQFACDHSIEHEVKSERILESFPHVNRTEVHLIPANTKIRVLWPADRVYYIATIMEHMEDGTTRIEYEDLTDEPLSEEATNDDPEHMKYEIIDLKNERIQLYKWKKNKLNHEKKVRTPKRKQRDDEQRAIASLQSIPAPPRSKKTRFSKSNATDTNQKTIWTIDQWKGKKAGPNIYAILYGKNPENGNVEYIGKIDYDWSTTAVMTQGVSGAIFKGGAGKKCKNTKKNYKQLSKWLCNGLDTAVACAQDGTSTHTNSYRGLPFCL